MGLARWAGRAAMIAGTTVGISAAAVADVRTSTRTQTYSVGGTSARSLVSYMRSNPFRGSNGDAVANIRPSYSLHIASKQSGGSCRASNVTLNISFLVTVPRARSALAGSTRSAWDGFVAFASRHENTHRQIYVECGNAFVAKAERLSSSSCSGLDAAIRQLLESEKRACESRQRAFDRAEYGRVKGLALFKMAGGSCPAARYRLARARQRSVAPRLNAPGQSPAQVTSSSTEACPCRRPR